MSELYYIQDVRAGHVGNSCLWWNKNGMGYGCDIRNAEKFSKEEAEKLAKSYKFVAWPCSYIDSKIAHHVDFQYLEEDIGGAIGVGVDE